MGWWFRRRRRRYYYDYQISRALVAFGAGLFLALFCSARLALLIAVIALIYIGIRCRPF